MYRSSTTPHVNSRYLYFQKIQESKWPEVGLLISSIVFFIIGSLASSGLPMGAVNVTSLTYSSYGLGTFFLITGIVKIALHCCSKKGQADLSPISSSNDLEPPTLDSNSPDNRSDQTNGLQLNRNPSDSTMSSTRTPHPYSSLGRSALEFARNKLQENAPQIQSFKLRNHGKTQKQTINQEIGDLYILHLHYDHLIQKFIDQWQSRRNDPWAAPAIIHLVNMSMQFCYAISCLTLEDLPVFTQQQADKGVLKSYAQTLMNQKSYFWELFSLVNNRFEAIRLGIFWKPTNSQETPEATAHNFINQASYQEKFYQKETPQNLWLSLSNDFCERLRTYVSYEELAAECSSSSIKTCIYKYHQGQRILFSKD